MQAARHQRPSHQNTWHRWYVPCGTCYQKFLSLSTREANKTYVRRLWKKDARTWRPGRSSRPGSCRHQDWAHRGRDSRSLRHNPPQGWPPWPPALGGDRVCGTLDSSTKPRSGMRQCMSLLPLESLYKDQGGCIKKDLYKTACKGASAIAPAASVFWPILKICLKFSSLVNSIPGAGGCHDCAFCPRCSC